jgi:hypothetical protein
MSTVERMPEGRRNLLVAAEMRLDGLGRRMERMSKLKSSLDRSTSKLESVARELRARLPLLRSEESCASTTTVVRFMRDVLELEKRLELRKPYSYFSIAAMTAAISDSTSKRSWSSTAEHGPPGTLNRTLCESCRLAPNRPRHLIEGTDSGNNTAKRNPAGGLNESSMTSTSALSESPIASVLNSRAQPAPSFA